ncbi:hypothetical protein CHARACLAT_011445 [Characodon lateralis]|uniref:Uncharacterized protein n=1 Tax=Characodon lateralis TaxID=208331 RepID=A0ABU7E0G8_9TELE|nr:hypothetical protein [Characodon lateralis]
MSKIQMRVVKRLAGPIVQSMRAFKRGLKIETGENGAGVFRKGVLLTAESCAILYVTSEAVCKIALQNKVLQDCPKYCSNKSKSPQPIEMRSTSLTAVFFLFEVLILIRVRSVFSLLPPLPTSHHLSVAVPYLTVFTKMNKFIQEKSTQSHHSVGFNMMLRGKKTILRRLTEMNCPLQVWKNKP